MDGALKKRFCVNCRFFGGYDDRFAGGTCSRIPWARYEKANEENDKIVPRPIDPVTGQNTRIGFVYSGHKSATACRTDENDCGEHAHYFEPDYNFEQRIKQAEREVPRQRIHLRDGIIWKLFRKS